LCDQYVVTLQHQEVRSDSLPCMMELQLKGKKKSQWRNSSAVEEDESSR
jgi:hypothetical protein